MKTILTLLIMFFTFFVSAQNGKIIGTIKTYPLQTGQSINYYIMSGNPSTAFKVDPSKGDLIINNQTAIDANTAWKYTLVVRLRYSKNGIVLGDTMRTIRILNLVNNKVIGKMVVTDPDNLKLNRQKISFYIMSGNYNTAFKIDGTGNISVANVTPINNWMVNNDKYILNIRARDNGVNPPNLTVYANAKILLFDGVQRQDVFNCR